MSYLEKLILHNGGKMPLPTTLQASDSDGGPAKITFERIIVWPDGRREIEGVTPKQLPAPASHELPNSTDLAAGASDINKL